MGVSSSNNHYKFTGKERDSESQLDYFGARYYSNGLGRFMSADWAAKPVTVPYANFGDPQTLNLYGYVQNAPMNAIDVNGHWYVFEPFQDWDFDIRQSMLGGSKASPNGGPPSCCVGNGGNCSRKEHQAAQSSQQGTLIVNPPVEYQEDILDRIKRFLYGLFNIADTPSPAAQQQNSNSIGDAPISLPLPASLAWINDVANGHGYDQHAAANASRQEYGETIQEAVEKAQENGDVRYRARDGATAYWYDGLLVIHNPTDPDKGTAYAPDSGRKAFEQFGDGPPPIEPK